MKYKFHFSYLDLVWLVPKLQLGNAALEAPASRFMASWSLQGNGSQAGAWEPAWKPDLGISAE